MALFMPDANILINALRHDSKAHHECQSWLAGVAQAGDRIGFCEVVEIALIRIITLPQMSFVPMDEVLGFWRDDLWTYSRTQRLAATTAQNRLFVHFLHDLGLAGNDVNDAWLAALAIDHSATLVSLDKGFSRFPGLSWFNPAA